MSVRSEAHEVDGACQPSAQSVAVTARPLVVPALIFLLAVIPRLLWVLIPDHDVLYGKPLDATAPGYAERAVDDITFYRTTAKSIAQGDGYAEPFLGTPTARYPPGWSLVLSVFYVFFGSNASPALVFNAVVGAASAVLAYYLGLRLFGRAIGLWSGIIMALFPAHILWSSLLLTEVLFAFVLTSILLIVGRTMGGWAAFGLGIMTAAAALIRGEAILLPIVFFAVLLARGATWMEACRVIAVVACGMAALLTPWAVRNSLQFGEPVYLTTSTGVNFMMGHASGVSGGGEFARFRSLAQEYRDVPEPRRQVEIERAALEEAWDGFLSDPLGDLALIPAKLRNLYGRDTTSTLGSLVFAYAWPEPLPFEVARLASKAYYYAVLGGVCLIVILRYPASWRGTYVLLFGVIALWSFTFGFLFFGLARYHISLLPTFSILAAGGYAMLFNRVARLGRTLSMTLAKAG
jgi:4-amino-4-deoxy-L-arabinose transferase-like glycosyltransferase